MIIIGLTGYAGAGKDTMGEVMVEHYGFHRLAFADAVRDMALALDPYLEIKGGPGPFGTIELYRLSEYLEVCKGDWNEAKKHPEVRQTLQRLGTECVRNILGDNQWIDVIERKIVPISLNHGRDRFVITDVRFPNEDDRLHTWFDAKLVRIHREGHQANADREHSSERYINILKADYEMTNNGTLEEFRATVHAFMHAFMHEFLGIKPRRRADSPGSH